MAWLSGWKNRIELKIEDYANDIGGAVTWFPVTIFLKDANGDSTKVFLEVGANSRKIALTKNDGTTELKGEIEDWSYDAGTPANSTAIIHTSADGWTINANTSIWLYYDNDHADNANVDVINTAAGAAVWDGNYKFVCHMVDDNGNVDDSTSNNNDGTKTGAGEPAEIAGKVGQAQDFDGGDDYINITNDASLRPQYFTISAIVKHTAEGVRHIFVSYYQDTTVAGINLRQYGDDSPYIKLALASGKNTGLILGTDYQVAYSNADINTGSWVHVVGTYDGVKLRVFINGVNDGEVAWTDDPGYDAANNRIDIGVSNYVGATFSGWFDGIIDEERVSAVARSAAWIKGEYNSLWDTLLNYGSEERIFEYVGTGTLTYSGSGICQYEAPDWEYVGSGELTYSGEATQSHTKYFLYDTSGNFVYSGEATISYLLNYSYVGSGAFVYSGSATQIYILYYLYAGSGVFSYSGEAVLRWGDWSGITKGSSDFTEIDKKTSNWSKVEKGESDWKKTIKL